MRTVNEAIEELRNRQERVEKSVGLNRTRYVSLFEIFPRKQA